MVEFRWSQAFVNGAVNWVAYGPHRVGGFQNLILAFNMGTKTFSKMMLPPNVANRHVSCLLVKLFEESLAVFCHEQMGRVSCCIWVMKEYEVVESWTKLFSIKLPIMLGKTLGFRKNGEVPLSNDNYWLLSYDPGTKQ
ncbi:F-box protein CPR1 [Camellia lanceoleosa]|uniref:F-box protein CPR1 n=1 Tax=Camellia lanceoleosa TaxID=1840588 RepID=A0ACC0HH90_9ERIC|nr:F-box protein CPR1 [Camellia lanceoleosa]